MKRIGALLLGLTLSSTSLANETQLANESGVATWSAPGIVTYISIANFRNHVYFQLSSPRVGGCPGRFYMLKAGTDVMGKYMVDLLLKHKESGEPIMAYTNGKCITEYYNAEVNILKTNGDNLSY